MNSRIWIVLVPLVILLLYPITKPLYASILIPDSSITVSGDYVEGGIDLRVNKDYQALMTEENGRVSFELGRVLGGNGEKAFNSNAIFVVGSSKNPVFTVINLSDDKVAVKIKDSEFPETILLHSSKNQPLLPGETANFYFEVDTSGTDIGQITAQLQILEAKD
ncbi:MAG: hypothetical protein R6U91_02520 [Bacillota bacterium]